MDWNRHQTFKHLSAYQVKTKIDELNKERKTIPVLKEDLDLNVYYIIEVWYHFRANIQMAIIYKESPWDVENSEEKPAN